MQTLQRGSRGEDVVMLQRTLNEQVGANLKRDGQFGPGVESALKLFQSRMGFPVNGIVDGDCLDYVRNYSGQRFIRLSDMDDYAHDLGVAPSALKAVYAVESRGEGFLMSGDPVILFEGHIFYKQLAKYKSASFAAQVTRSNPNICYSKWDKTKYKGGQAEHNRLNEAMGVHKQAALESASWGLFQLMGFNATSVGYTDVFEYAEAMDASEFDQLFAGCEFIRSNKAMHQALIKMDWAGFALRYNGSGYAANKYDVRMRDAEKRFR